MNLKPVFKQFGIDEIIGIDFETYYDNKVTLKKMANTEYIYDPKFAVHMVAVQRHSWKKPRVMTPRTFRSWAAGVNWRRAGILAHHAQFDGLIARTYFGVKAKAYFDTLSMARPVMPVHVGKNLVDLCAAFGREAKTKADALVNIEGVEKLSPAQYRALAEYAGDDIEDTWFLFDKLLPCTLPQELRLIDITMRMYANPRLLIDADKVDALHDAVNDDKEQHRLNVCELFNRPIATDQLVSNDKFVELMRELGYEPPVKVSKTTGEDTYALAKGDLEFKKLLAHEDPQLRTLIAARMALKTSIVASRTKRMSNRAAHGEQPIYLNYWGAKTGRWSGGDKANWQNLSRGSDMRKAIYAPDTHKLIIADLAQIEARMNAYIAYQQDVVDAFARGDDVYCLAASKIYNRKITPDDKNERFVGKVATLALGYGAGAVRFAEMLRLGSFGPPVDISDAEAEAVVRAWRQANSRIVNNWKTQQSYLTSAFIGKQTINDEFVTYEGHGHRGLTVLPDSTYIRYDGIKAHGSDISYLAKSFKLKKGGVSETRQKLYGGLIVENNTQALARSVIGNHMIMIEDAMPWAQIVMSTHDEIVSIVPNRYADRALRLTKEIMTVAPDWAKGLPLGVDAHVSQRYDK